MKIAANGLLHRYRLEGPPAAPVVTLVHSLAATLDLWDAQAGALADRYRVLRYDVRGHGGSEVPPGPYTLAQMAEDLRALLQALGIERTHFVGLSMGGCIGLTAALRYPSLFRSLALADTTSRYAPHTAAMWAERIRAAETAGMAAVVEPTLSIWFTAGFRARRPEAVARVAAMFRATDPRGYVAAIRAIASVDLTSALGAIPCPTLVLVGEHDPGTPPAMARTLQERIPGAELVVLAGAAHCSCVEAADDFSRALRAFLERVEAREAG